MTSSRILLPCVALVALTAIVWVRLYVDRIGEMRSRRIRAQALATSRDTQALQRVSAAENFRNLFEVPVLFYALCIALAATGTASGFFVAGAWVYVALRALHSFIHVTYNRVMHRFAVYSLSTLLLFLMWAVFGAQLVGG
jgi:hypothetical protein